MIVTVIFLLSVNPFYEANFVSLPMRSVSVFTNPAGLGIQPGAEFLFTYHPDKMLPALTLGNIGFGMTKIDSVKYYEAGLGYKLPGAFSLGYAHQFGDTANHILGLIGRSSPYISIGYRTTVGERFHMIGGMSIRPFQEYVTISGDIEYEGIDSILNYSYGVMLMPTDGIKMNFHAGHRNDDFNWNAGIELSFSHIKIAGAYSSIDEKFSGGIILSAQSYNTFLPERIKITKLRLEGSYPEVKKKSFFGIPLSTQQGFTKLLSNLESFITRDDIKIVLVELKECALEAAQTEELGRVLSKLRNADKHVIFFADNYHGTLMYEFACNSDEIILSPPGSVIIPGLALRKIYLKGTLDKLGLETEIVQVGKYKSATEIFTRITMSDPDRKQLARILDDIYFPTLDSIAQSRNKTREEIEEFIDTIAYFNSDDAKTYGLIDTVLYDFELKDYLHQKYGNLPIVDFEAIVNKKSVEEVWHTRHPKIALVIAEGSMVPGEGKPGFLQTSLIGSEKYVKIFERIKNDKSIKAVILRINSGGGYAVASEKITYAVKRCAEEKPVIVTMGGVAGSGGYQIACLADKIYANNRTITGSIGVFDLKFVISGLYEKLGVSWDYVKRGNHSDAFWGLRHLTDEELKKEEKEVRWWYDKFTSTVAEGRGMSQQRVDSLGQGRVYSGTYARELGLVDEIGGYLDALNTAKEIVGVTGKVNLEVYPRKTGFSFLNTTQTHSRVMYLMPTYELK